MIFESSKLRSDRCGSSVSASVGGLLCLASLLPLAAGCQDAPRRPLGDGRVRVLATTTVVADLVRQVGGERVEVSCLMAAGIDPHSYKPTPRDADRLATADLVVANGLDLEGRLAEMLGKLERTRPVVAVAEAIPRSDLLPAGGGQHDPHVWFDPTLWRSCCAALADALATVDPPGAAGYRSRAAAYSDRLAAVDDRVRRRIETIPAERRVLVTAHDAFRYFGRRYGFEVLGIQGLSTESEAGLKQVEELVSLLVKRRIPAVFVESTIPERSVRALIAGAKARGHEVAIGGELFSDAMGPPGTYEGTYVGMIDHNVTTIARALGLEPPAGGFQGRLARKE